MYSHLPTRQKLRSVPELTPNQIKEVWQADKWLYEVPNEVLVPMVRVGDKDFYINELVYCSDKTWFIPHRFFDFEGKRLAVGRAVQSTSVRYYLHRITKITMSHLSICPDGSLCQ